MQCHGGNARETGTLVVTWNDEPWVCVCTHFIHVCMYCIKLLKHRMHDGKVSYEGPWELSKRCQFGESVALHFSKNAV